MTDRDQTTKCPFGCDKPWPHEPGDCVLYLSDEGWDELQRVLHDPPEPTIALHDAVRRFKDMVQDA